MFAIYIACAVLGTLAVAVRGFVFTQVSLNTKVFTHQIEKLLAANNADRAIRLCNAAQKTPIASITRSMLELHLAGASGAELREVFEDMYGKTAVRFAQGALLTNLALGLSAIMLALPAKETGIPLSSSLIAPACIAIVAGVLTMSFQRLRNDIGAAGDQLVAAMSD